MISLKEKYQKVVIPAMREKFGYKNNLAIPRLEKVVVNVGTGQGLKDARFNEVVEDTFKRITGQRPIKLAAKKAISNFKIRQGLVVGMKTTLRGKRMNDFVEKLINITLPRVRDFQGLSPTAVDPSGNLNIGFREHIAFPEIKSDEVEKIHGLEVSIITTAKNQAEGLELLSLLGFPFRKEK